MSQEDKGCGCRDISKLLDGLRTFKERFYNRDPDLMRSLVLEGQRPATLLIGCSDSRVDPSVLTGAGPGEIFTVRNVANLVPPYEQKASLHGTGAAIEYAVRDLGVDHIVVLGHAHCGGIAAMLAGEAGQPLEREFIADWVSLARKACEHYVTDDTVEGGHRPVGLERLRENPALVERAAVRGSLDNLLSYPWIRERVEKGTLILHGWWFDLETGDLWKTEPGSGTTLLPMV